MHPSTIVSFISLIAAASAVATVTRCDVVAKGSAPGSAFNIGNRFTVHIDNVPNVSESTICGHSDQRIHQAADGFSTRVNSKVDCHTSFFNNDRNTMDLVVRFDKQSPDVQRNALHNGLVTAFGSAGLVFDINVCNIDDIPK